MAASSRQPLTFMLKACSKCKCRLNCHFNVTFVRHKSSFRRWNTLGSKYNVRVVEFSSPRVMPRMYLSAKIWTADTSDSVKQPFDLIRGDLKNISESIKDELVTMTTELQQISRYHFDGLGKSFRPMVAILMAKAVNSHNDVSLPADLLKQQYRVAIIAEMIHTASLMHDDVIDTSEIRRGKDSAQHVWGQKKAVLAGDFILARASMALARLGNPRVIEVLAQVLEDLVRGEFMQLSARDEKDDRFGHYLKKTFNKTASLFANSCKAVSILAASMPDVEQLAYHYGRHLGLAFQLVDDVLDFVSTDSMLGKPAAADLRLGLATAPVLFAAQEYPELNPMITRRFRQEGDVERASECVSKSNGVEQTRYLAEQHSAEAAKLAHQLSRSDERDALVTLTQQVLSRLK